MLSVLPFANSIDLITLKGKHIRKALQDSAGRLSANGANGEGGFLQVAGIKMIIDLRKTFSIQSHGIVDMRSSQNAILFSRSWLVAMTGG